MVNSRPSIVRPLHFELVAWNVRVTFWDGTANLPMCNYEERTTECLNRHRDGRLHNKYGPNATHSPAQILNEILDDFAVGALLSVLAQSQQPCQRSR